MPNLKQYFQNDFKQINMDRVLTFDIDNQKIEIDEKVLDDVIGGTRYFVFYIPETDLTPKIVLSLINQFEERKLQAEEIISNSNYLTDINIGQLTKVYSNRIYFYIETPIVIENINFLNNKAKEKNLFITFRDSRYSEKRMELDKPMAFICHDSRDKELIAKPLANGLSSRLCTVWYDEYSLEIGDSLRESIERGIKEVKKCVIIITRNFLDNPGWGKKEFSSIFTREMIFNERIVLPIWYDVTKEDVYEYSPSLVDTFALIWPNPKELTEEDYKKNVELLISKLHTAINK